MTKRYNMNKVRWYAMLLSGVPYPLPFDEDKEMEEKRRHNAHKSRMVIAAMLGMTGALPYFTGK